jgi:hypothetical protein
MQPGAASDSEPSIRLGTSSPDSVPTLTHCRRRPSSGSYSPSTGFIAGTGALPQGKKCTYTSALQAPAILHDPTHLWQDSPQEQVRSPRGQSVLTLQTPGVPTAQEAGLTAGAAGQCTRTALPESPRPTRRDFERSRSTPSKTGPTRIGKTLGELESGKPSEIRSGAAADSEPSIKLRASSPQQCTYTRTLQAPSFLVLLSPFTGCTAGAGALPQGDKCSYTSIQQAPAVPRDPIRLRQDSPQERARSPRGQSVLTLQTPGVPTA